MIHTTFLSNHCRLTIKRLLLLLSFLIMPTMLSAWTEGLESAAEALQKGTATPKQRFFVYEHINEINDMALDGALPDDVYQSSQGDFWDRNYADLKKAAAEEGLDISMEKPKRFEPGTDTDAALTRQAGSNTDITVDKLKKVENNYKNNMRKNYKDAGLEVPEKLADTNTDILVDPDATSEFQKCAAHVNNNGGTAYTNPDAVRAEIKMGRGEPISIKEASAYTDEVGRLAQEKASKARELRHKAQATQNYDPAKAKKLRAQAQLNDSQASKYINRSDKAANNLRRQHGLDDLPIDTKSGLDKAIRKIDKKTGLGRGIATKNDAIAIGTMHKHASEKAGQKFIDTLSDIAKKSPHVAKDMQKAIAKSLNKMSPSAQGRAIEALERKVGKSFTKGVVKNAKALRKAATKIRAAKNIKHVKRAYGAKPPGPMHYAMLGLGAYFMGKDGVYHALKKVKADSTVTGFVLDVFAESVYHGSGFGYAWEEAVAEMKQDYIKQLASGKPPSLSRDIGVTVVKTGFYMGRDLVVMAIYLPDTLYELITGEKDAQRREAYSKQFLAAVQKKMRQKKALEDAKAEAKKDGIYPEDLINYFHCLCSEGCTMMLGGYYNPGFNGDGHGNCKCSGPLMSFKTPMASNKNDKNGCFNTITQMNYANNRAIFDQWNKAAIANNADSVKKEVQAIENNISDGTIMEVTDLFQAIEPLLLPGTSQASNIRARMDHGLRKQAAEHISDVKMEKPLHTAVKKIQKAVDLYKGRGGSDQNRREDLEKILAKYKMWEKNWNEVIEKIAPEIEKLFHQNKIFTARDKLQAIHARRGKDLPDRYKTDQKDPIFLKLNILQKKKFSEWDHQERKLHNTLVNWKKRKDPRGAMKELEKFFKDWEIDKYRSNDYYGNIIDLKEALRIAEGNEKRGDIYRNKNTYEMAAKHYRISLSIQKDRGVQKKLAYVLEEISLAKEVKDKADAKRAKSAAKTKVENNRHIVGEKEKNNPKRATKNVRATNEKIEATYIGCYKDKGHRNKVVPPMKNRVMNGYTFRGNMTILKCAKVCSGQDFKYAGLQYANHCFCGNEYEQYGIANNCNMPCSGNQNEICGGAWANSVYALSVKSYDKQPVVEKHHQDTLEILSANGVVGNTKKIIEISLESASSKLIKIHITEGSELTHQTDGKQDGARIGEVEFYANGRKITPYRVAADSTFGDRYSIDQIIDGDREYRYMTSGAKGWASADKQREAWITFYFAQEVDITKAIITTAPTRPYRLYSFSLIKYKNTRNSHIRIPREKAELDSKRQEERRRKEHQSISRRRAEIVAKIQQIAAEQKQAEIAEKISKIAAAQKREREVAQNEAKHRAEILAKIQQIAAEQKQAEIENRQNQEIKNRKPANTIENVSQHTDRHIKETSLEGKWSGWGEVILRRSGDSNRYIGTYTDTYGPSYSGGSKKGYLELVLVDNTCSGVWGEGTIRRGSIRCQLSQDGKIIKGIYRTDGKQGVGGEIQNGKFIWRLISNLKNTKVDPSGEWVTDQQNNRLDHPDMILVRSSNRISGSYTIDNGKIWGVLKSNTLDGYWAEDDSQQKCDKSINGNYHWGRIRFIFENDTFTGAWGYCRNTPDHLWNGRRIK